MALTDKMLDLFRSSLSQSKRGVVSRMAERPDFDSERSMPGGVAESETLGLFNWYEERTSVSRSLTARYVDYESMDDNGDFSSVLDTYADESTQADQMKRRAAWVSSRDSEVERRGMRVLDAIGFENDAWGCSRSMCKYGNLFGELLVDDSGVFGVKYMDAPTVRVIAMRDEVIGYVQDDSGAFNIDPKAFKEALARKQYHLGSMTLFEPFEVVHFKLMMRKLRALYGLGVGEPVRALFKRIAMLEDTSVLYKLVRTPVRMAHYIETGDIPADRKLSYVKQVQAMNRRKKYKTPDGKMHLDWNPLNPLEEYWLPTGGGRGDTRLEVIAGSDYQSTELLELFQKKFDAAVKVPRSFTGLGEQLSGSNLSAQDVRFARAVMRVQRSIKTALEYVVGIDMIVRNVDVLKTPFSVEMAVPSAIFELARLEVWNARADLMTRLEAFIPWSWMLTNIIMLSDREAEDLMKRKRKEDREKGIWDAETMAKSNELTMPSIPDGGPEGQEAVQPDALIPIVQQRDWEQLSERESRRLRGKLDELLARDVRLAQRLEHVRSLVVEIVASTKSRQ